MEVRSEGPALAPTTFPETECARHLLLPGFAEVAEWRAAQVGVTADRVLVTAGYIAEDTYLKAFASSLGIAFEPLVLLDRRACVLPDHRLVEAGATGLLPLRIDGDSVLVVAPRGLATRRLATLLRLHPDLRSRFRITSAQRLQRFIQRYGAAAVGQRAAESLRIERPLFSAATRMKRSRRLAVAALVALAVAGLTAPGATMAAIGIGFSIFSIAWIALRLLGALTRERGGRVLARTADDRLPIYSIIVALHREADVVEGLVKALRQLDYPAEKLQIILVVEPDDDETRAAIARLALTAPFLVVVAPEAGPRTKPKALNAALPLATGAYTAIFDAEDRPEPNQLRCALDAFADNRRIACVQARLTIDNTADGWLARLFTAEYAGQFDVFLPALARWQVPLPLGGSSNHFRTAMLREIGGWDPYNVTEDADLGQRLARHGYRTAMISSTTYEEAPARLKPWVRQRTRWFKGWMQTWLVHMRQPLRLARELGMPGFAVFQLVVGGTVLAALVHLPFLAVLATALVGGGLSGEENIVSTALAALYGTALAGGYVTSGILGYMGLARRGLHTSAAALVLIPVHWVLLSFAAWRALVQLVTDPFTWEKTEHGVARTSRRAQNGDPVVPS